MDLSAEGTAERKIFKLTMAQGLLLLILSTNSLQGIGQTDTTVYAVLPVEIKDKQIDFQNFINMDELRTNIKGYKILSFHISYLYI